MAALAGYRSSEADGGHLAVRPGDVPARARPLGRHAGEDRLVPPASDQSLDPPRKTGDEGRAVSALDHGWLAVRAAPKEPRREGYAAYFALAVSERDGDQEVCAYPLAPVGDGPRQPVADRPRVPPRDERRRLVPGVGHEREEVRPRHGPEAEGLQLVGRKAPQEVPDHPVPPSRMARIRSMSATVTCSRIAAPGVLTSTCCCGA